VNTDHELKLDALILGTGIAGLWTLNHLTRLGYDVIAVEPRAIASHQTIASQGIIHGGIKYALTGSASQASRAIAQMPEIWRDCLAGKSAPDLSRVRVLSPHQHLWTTSGTLSRLMGLAASKVIRTGVTPLDAADRPASFASAKNISVYRVDEPILDPHSLAQELSRGQDIIRGDVRRLDRENGYRIHGEWYKGKIDFDFRARKLILCAGAANAQLQRELNIPDPAPMQTRPLHMVMVRSPHLPELFGHCIAGDLTDKPRITITSQRDTHGNVVWYVGGLIAESGVQRERDAQIAAAKAEVAHCVPWVNLDGAQWSTLRIDRAEGLTEKGERPDEPIIAQRGSTIIAWPTKLAFAPLVAQRIAAMLPPPTHKPEPEGGPSIFEDFAPRVAPLPWNDPEATWT
jgi:glycerol-3-phosphate dehydrogenase